MMNMTRLSFIKPKITTSPTMLVLVLIFGLSCTLGLADDNNEMITEFDPSSRGDRKIGDKCEMTYQCGVEGSICYQQACTCNHFLSTNHVNKCGKAVSVNESCFFNEQCEDSVDETECRDGRCICRFDKIPMTKTDGSIECMIALKEKDTTTDTQVNPAVYLILVVIVLMVVIIIYAVLRLFSK